MCEPKPYVCINCGEEAAALYKSYGSSVLKLTKCDKCNGIVDKYVEYDPVIVMIDLVLMSREAQRHVIYNTEFKVYWKLFIVLVMLETYGVWRNNSLFTVGVHAMCEPYTDSESHLDVLDISIPDNWKSNCAAWTKPTKSDNTDLFIWEKDFYIQFISTFSGIAAFIATTYCLMGLCRYLSARSTVSLESLLKAYSLAGVHAALRLPSLVWGAGAAGGAAGAVGGAEGAMGGAAGAGAEHHALVELYGAAVVYNVYTVIYRLPKAPTILVLLASYYTKYAVTYSMLPRARDLVK